jgi:hypothetical protein
VGSRTKFAAELDSSTSSSVFLKGTPMQQRSRASDLWLILLLIPFVALLYVPFYGHATPKLGPIPFFIWYQFLWVILGSIITGLVYVLRGR